MLITCSKDYSIYEVMWKYMVELERPEVQI